MTAAQPRPRVSPGAVARLIASARRGQRPRWSQSFLAQELTRLGYDASRDRIARLERSAPTAHDPRLVAAAAAVMRVPSALVHNAILDDFEAVASGVHATLRGDFASGGSAAPRP